MSHLPGKFVWFEHSSPDPARARAFYQELLGWNVQSMPVGDQSYDMIMLGAEGIGGIRKAESGTPSHWMSYLSVPDVDAAFRAATSHGAGACLAPMDFGPVGRAAIIADPTGATVSLWKGAQGDRPDVEQTALGDWFWNELLTPDAPRALAFYEQAFGFSHEDMDMGPGGIYHLLKSADGKMRGGLMQSNLPQMPPMWLPYVKVADCDASVAHAGKLGATTVLVPPADIPNIGRFSVLLDPLGAAIALMKPAG